MHRLTILLAECCKIFCLRERGFPLTGLLLAALDSTGGTKTNLPTAKLPTNLLSKSPQRILLRTASDCFCRQRNYFELRSLVAHSLPCISIHEGGFFWQSVRNKRLQKMVTPISPVGKYLFDDRFRRKGFRHASNRSSKRKFADPLPFLKEH